MMNFPGAIAGNPEVMAKIAAAKAVGKPADGHAPGLVGEDRMRYELRIIKDVLVASAGLLGLAVVLLAISRIAETANK